MTGCGGLGGGCKVCVGSPAVVKEGIQEKENRVQNRTWRNVGLLMGKHIHVRLQSP